MLTRRELLAGAAALAGSTLLLSGMAFGQSAWPTRPITITIGNAPGGDDDTLSRFLAPSLTQTLGQSVVVENRVGGSTTVAGNTVASAKPDGYTLLCLITAGVVQTQLRKNLTYNLDSFVPIAKIGGYPLALIVSAKMGIDSVDELIAASKTADGVTFASGGVGTVGHLTSTMFLKEIGGKGVHVSYKNNPEGIQALAGGFTQMIFASAREGGVLKDDPNLKVLAVTSPERTANLPDVPTLKELGYGDIDQSVWYSYAAPAGTPNDVVQKLKDAIVKGVEDPAFEERFGAMAFQTDIRTGEDLKTYIASEANRFKQVIAANDIQLSN
ncbi:tripartite tricarboxylate transporter substrate binding protein [Aureimonas sp. AU22]|uniref:Bug family tripartite tricarboxylate transporter substrate binding protein n=1 Tax=Aureimonas sp. AU22 TaxID=1638162 RepID=UPI0007836ED8|nr:tripartite tricarboxylate transporter substrate binding protein [Aureimonas sp. AU22]